jgi:hypothetical protein
MDGSKARKEGKTRRVSPRRELAVVTLAAVASISGVGGLLAGQHLSAPVQPASAARATLASPEQPRPTKKPIALKQASYRGEDGVEADDDGVVVFQPANRARPMRHNGTAAHTPVQSTRPSAVSQGSAPVN